MLYVTFIKTMGEKASGKNKSKEKEKSENEVMKRNKKKGKKGALHMKLQYLIPYSVVDIKRKRARNKKARKKK